MAQLTMAPPLAMPPLTMAPPLTACQAALGEWEQLCELARDEWGSPRLDADPEARAEVARLAASAACNLRLWEEVGRYGGAMRDVSVESVF